jgi:hypothetical protein
MIHPVHQSSSLYADYTPCLVRTICIENIRFLLLWNMTIQLFMTSCIYMRAAWFVERGGWSGWGGSRKKKRTDKGKSARCPLKGRCGGPHSRYGRFLEEKNDSCHCQESSHDSPVVLTQSLHRQCQPSTAINRCSLRGISTDGKDTNLQLRALHALHATNTR